MDLTKKLREYAQELVSLGAKEGSCDLTDTAPNNRGYQLGYNLTFYKKGPIDAERIESIRRNIKALEKREIAVMEARCQEREMTTEELQAEREGFQKANAIFNKYFPENPRQIQNDSPIGTSTTQLPKIVYGSNIRDKHPIIIDYLDAIVATEISQFTKKPKYSYARAHLRKMTDSVTQRVIGRKSITETELYRLIKQAMEENELRVLAEAFELGKDLASKV